MEEKAIGFDKMAREIFAPVYPVIAEQIKEKTGIIKGKCLDIGSAGGYLGLALAKITDLEIHLFDKSMDMLEIAEKNIKQSGLGARVKTLHGDVHDMLLDDQSIDLVISRGSVFFWEDPVKAFQEIFRVLTPGGITYIGGGFGRPELFEEIQNKMQKVDVDWEKGRQTRMKEKNSEYYREKLQSAGIKNFEIENDEVGMWIVIRRAD
jgi:ubiquinone/menaquinone biosynthesis C-methylase UbiE